MNFIFRVDSSLEIGTGHVMRCLTLAKKLKESNNFVEFICRKHEGNLIDKIITNGFNVYELDSTNEIDSSLSHSSWLKATQEQDANDCIDLLRSIKIDWIIVDHYALDFCWESQMNKICEKIMVLDDLADRRHFCNILLDQTFLRNEKDYKELVPQNCRLFLGSEYALLRPEFIKWRSYSLERRKNSSFKNLLVNFGGVDLNNFTEQILDELSVTELPPDIKIVIVMGQSSPHLNRVILKANKIKLDIEVKIDIDNMAELMANADICIGATGTTAWERCCLGLPAINIITAENQKDIAQNLSKKNAITLLPEVKDLSSIIRNIKYSLNQMSLISRKISDGLGSERISKALVNIRL